MDFTFISALWLPILLSAVAVFLLAMVMWMASPLHHMDRDDTPRGRELAEHIAKLGIGPGSYNLPDKAAFMESCKKDSPLAAMPIGLMSIMHKDRSMAIPMLGSFLIYVATAFMIACLLAPLMPANPSFQFLFRHFALAGVLGYSFASLPIGVWYQAKPIAQFNLLLDGILYGLATGAIFAWLWPQNMTFPL